MNRRFFLSALPFATLSSTALLRAAADSSPKISPDISKDTSSLTSAIPLWPQGAPGALGTGPGHEPKLTPFLPNPENATGAAMLVLPGGGYGIHSDLEGADYARWLAARGIAAFVLNYRLGSAGYRHPVMLEDAARGLRLIREHAPRLGLDTRRVGVIGSSAGGHLAAILMTLGKSLDTASSDPVERHSARPDLGVLCYPVILTTGPHANSCVAGSFLPADASPELIELVSPSRQVTVETPPCFLWHTQNDEPVPCENSLAFAVALRRAGVPFELHIYSEGGHALGLCDQPNDPVLPWTTDLIAWLMRQKFLRAPHSKPGAQR